MSGDKKDFMEMGFGIHFVIICDEDGIFDAFNFISDQLSAKSSAFLSFIYIISDDNCHPLFENELSILERRYSGRLIVHSVKNNKNITCCKPDLIEATINSNTFGSMKFLVFGKSEFVNYLFGILRFLDVQAPMIKLKSA